MALSVLVVDLPGGQGRRPSPPRSSLFLLFTVLGSPQSAQDDGLPESPNERAVGLSTKQKGPARVGIYFFVTIALLLIFGNDGKARRV